MPAFSSAIAIFGSVIRVMRASTVQHQSSKGHTTKTHGYLLDHNVPVFGDIGSTVRPYLSASCIHRVSNVGLCHAALVFVAREGPLMKVQSICRDYQFIYKYDKPVDTMLTGGHFEDMSVGEILRCSCGSQMNANSGRDLLLSSSSSSTHSHPPRISSRTCRTQAMIIRGAGIEVCKAQVRVEGAIVARIYLIYCCHSPLQGRLKRSACISSSSPSTQNELRT